MNREAIVMLVSILLDMVDEEMAINEQAVITVMIMRRHKLQALRKYMSKLQQRRRRVYQPLRG